MRGAACCRYVRVNYSEQVAVARKSRGVAVVVGAHKSLHLMLWVSSESKPKQTLRE